MDTTAKIIPAIMPDDYEDLVSKAALVRLKVDWVQIDVMDGKYTGSVSWPYEHSEHFDEILNQDEGLPFWQDLNYELDLMVQNPEEEYKKWIDAGAGRIILHLKTLQGKNISEIINEIKSFGVEVGIAILPNEDYSIIENEIDNLDFVQFMGIEKVGFQNQEFATEILDQIKNFREKYPNKIISVDGGVGPDTAKRLVNAGVNRLVSGSFVFEGSPEENIKDLEDSLI
jgi:ribulose-phosphate 3-epimerase